MSLGTRLFRRAEWLAEKLEHRLQSVIHRPPMTLDDIRRILREYLNDLLTSDAAARVTVEPGLPVYASWVPGMPGHEVAEDADVAEARDNIEAWKTARRSRDYASVSDEVEELVALGCEKVFSERVSSVARRDRLEAALEFVREGDVLVVTKLDRLARSVSDLLAIEARLKAKSVGLRVLSMGGAELDTSTPTGKLMLTMFGAIAEFERALMLERQRGGIAKAKEAGKYRGRAPTARRKAEEIKRLRDDGVKPTEIAARLGIGRASVYRVLSFRGEA